MATKEKNEVATVAKTQVAVAADFLLGDLNGGLTGFEGAGQESYAIPFVSILQKMSPQVDEDDPAHIPGAKAGSFINSVTGKITDGKTGLLFIPVAYKRSFIEWGGREGPSPGYKGQFTKEEVDDMITNGVAKESEGKIYVLEEDGTFHEKKSNRLEDTREHYIIVLDEETGEFGQAIMALSSSQIKASKMLMTSLSQKKINAGGRMVTPPTFANVVRATTVGMSNDKGTWSGAKFDLESLISNPDLYTAAKEFGKQVTEGAVAADFNKAPEQPAGEGGATQADGF